MGAFFATFIAYGWGLVGPPLAARASEQDRPAIFLQGFTTQICLAFAAVPIGSTLAYVLAPGEAAWLAVAMAVNMMIGGMTIAWFAIGLGRPSLILIYELLPRAIGTIIAVPLIVATGQALVYPTTLATCAAFGLAAFVRTIAAQSQQAWPSRRDVVAHLKRDRGAAGTVMIAGLYTSAPTSISSVVLPVSDVAYYVSAERVYRVGLGAITSLANALQGWVLTNHSPRDGSRAVRALVAHSVLGVSGGVGLYLLGPLASRVLFGDRLAGESNIFLGLAIAFAAISINTSTSRHVLVPAGRSSAVLFSTFVGAGLGLVGIVIGGQVFGAAGVAMAFGLSETGVAITQLIGCASLVRGRRQSGPSPVTS